MSDMFLCLSDRHRRSNFPDADLVALIPLADLLNREARIAVYVFTPASDRGQP